MSIIVYIFINTYTKYVCVCVSTASTGSNIKVSTDELEVAG